MRSIDKVLVRGRQLGVNQKATPYNWNYLINNYGYVKLIKGDMRNLRQSYGSGKGHGRHNPRSVTTSVKDPNHRP